MNTRKQLKQFVRSFRDLWNHGHLYRWLLFISFALFVATLILPLWRLVPLAKETAFIPLHYNIYFGVDRFGPWYEVFLLPTLALLFLILNVTQQTFFLKTEKILTQFFAFSTFIIELTLLVAMVLIILLNI